MHRIALIPLLAALAGCYTEENLRLTLADTVPVSPIDPTAQVTYLDVPAEPITIMRTNWEPVPFIIPVDGTDHHYLGRTDIPCTDATARQRGEFPTPLTALETEGDTDMQFVEGFEQPLWGAWDALLLLPRLIGWTIVNQRDAVSPDVTYDRFPTDRLTFEQRALWLGELPPREPAQE